MNETLRETVNKGLPPKHSVISQGVYEAHISEGLPKAFPDRRPHYE